MTADEKRRRDNYAERLDREASAALAASAKKAVLRIERDIEFLKSCGVEPPEFDYANDRIEDWKGLLTWITMST